MLADTGLPGSSYANTASVTESLAGLATYIPTAGQPGFVSGFFVTYNFISSPNTSAVPESGSSALLLCIAWQHSWQGGGC